MAHNPETVYEINQVVIQTLRQMKSAMAYGIVPLDNPYLRLEYLINFDENFQPIFQGENKDNELKAFNALFDFTSHSQIVLDLDNADCPLIASSKDLDFVSKIENHLKPNKTYKINDVLGFYTSDLRTEIEVFELNDPNKTQKIQGKYLFRITPLFIDKKAKKGFYQITVGLELSGCKLNAIHPNLMGQLFDTFIRNLENEILKSAPKLNELFVNTIEITSQNQVMVENFFNNLNKAPRVDKLVFIPDEAKEDTFKIPDMNDLEAVIIELVVQGLSNPIIAERLYGDLDKEQYIKNKLSEIYSKLHIDGDAKGKRQKLKEIYLSSKNKHD